MILNQSTIPIRRNRAGALLVTLAVVLGACGSGDEPNAGEVVAVATTSILGDVASQVAGTVGPVEVLIPNGTDPHSFQASPRQAALLRSVPLVIVNGLGLEAGLGDVIDSAKRDGANVLEVAPLLNPLPFAGDPAVDDPHVWLDPRRMDAAVTAIADALAAVLPESAEVLRANAGAYREELAAVDEEIESILEMVQQRVLVTNHDALGYFADRYGFAVLGTIIPSGTILAEPGAAELGDLALLIEREGVRAIFADTTRPTRLAEALAAEVGFDVRVVSLYTGSLGPPGSDAGTYLGMLRVNAARVAEGLAA